MFLIIWEGGELEVSGSFLEVEAVIDRLHLELGVDAFEVVVAETGAAPRAPERAEVAQWVMVEHLSGSLGGEGGQGYPITRDHMIGTLDQADMYAWKVAVHDGLDWFPVRITPVEV
ncbi:MAG: hypothetical protein EBU84_05620 [Actinobacteria bacterium]|nr:hypothetical protein [Actinomycetota bacterium]